MLPLHKRFFHNICSSWSKFLPKDFFTLISNLKSKLEYCLHIFFSIFKWFSGLLIRSNNKIKNLKILVSEIKWNSKNVLFFYSFLDIRPLKKRYVYEDELLPSNSCSLLNFRIPMKVVSFLNVFFTICNEKICIYICQCF